jgi:hypothetical protein
MTENPDGAWVTQQARSAEGQRDRRAGFVGTTRRECLDWILVVNRRHLERVLRTFADHYRLLSQRPGRFQGGTKLARPVRVSESGHGSTDHGHPIAAAGAGGESPLRLLEWRISDVDRRISPYIPATLRPWYHPIRSSLSLQIGHFGAIAQLAERLDRTQEVGGSNPPSSISANALQMQGLALGGSVRTGRLIPLFLGASAQSRADIRRFRPDSDSLGRLAGATVTPQHRQRTLAGSRGSRAAMRFKFRPLSGRGPRHPRRTTHAETPNQALEP